MSAWRRFYRLGVEDADRRVAAALAPPPIDAVDRYLQASRSVLTLDRATVRLRDWWHASAAARGFAIARDGVRRQGLTVRYQNIAFILLSAVVTHVMLMWRQGPRPGWFWTVIPVMVAAFAALLLAGSRSAKPTE